MSRFVGLAVALALIPTLAQAKDDAAYVNAGLGITQVKNVEWEISGRPRTNVTNFHTGQFDAGFSAGYDFGVLRAEGELVFQRSRIHDYTLRVPTKLNELPSIPAGFYPKATGYIHRASFMANVIAEQGGNTRIGVYAGLGAGITRTRIDNWRIAGVDPFLKGDSTRFAWQAIGGVRAPIGKHLEVGLRYRYHDARGFRYRSRQGNEPFEGNFRSHSMLVMAGWNF